MTKDALATETVLPIQNALATETSLVMESALMKETALAMETPLVIHTALHPPLIPIFLLGSLSPHGPVDSKTWQVFLPCRWSFECG